MTTAAWWQQAVWYEIYMPSFCDGNGDGIGDFPGITSKLPELVKLGVDGVWLTPFYKSPKVDNGYDIADYYAIDPDYGTMEQFDAFIQEARRLGIKVIVDLVLNHTSAAHPWFQQSKSSRENPKRDWYIWKDPVEREAPNNWESFFGGSAWEYDEATEQYYYHAFAKEQVDLNWANPEVRAAMKDVMGFWLDKGVDGFRLDVINFLKVSDDYPDNPYNSDKHEQEHLYDKDQNGILDAIADICAYVHDREGKFMVGEVGSEDMEQLKRYSGSGMLDVVFNFNLGSQASYKPERFMEELERMEQLHAKDQIPTLFFGSHDMARFISRFGDGDEELEEKRAKLMAALMLTAKGVPFIYYGDEVGMRDYVAPRIADMRDVQGLTAYQLALDSGKPKGIALAEANEKCRDKSRTPMQWNGDEYGGFSTSEPWISMGPEVERLNVEAQRGRADSIYSFYQALLRLRKENPALHQGQYVNWSRSENVLVYERQAGNSKALILLNFGEKPAEVPVGSTYNRQPDCSSCQAAKTAAANVYSLAPYEAAVWVN
ncbi:alpha-glucosidase [Paenibacillus marinisediminis]